MALKAVVDDLETVPETLRGEYTEKDGKFYLSIDDLDNHHGVAGLKTALNSERQLRARHEKQVKAWEKLGKTAEEIDEMLRAQQERDEKAAREKGDFDSILKQHQDKWAQEKASLEAEVNASRASERSAVVGERVLGALAKAGATEEGAELLPDRLANRIKFETVDGKRVLKITQADGETPMAGTGADGTATIDDLVKEAVTKYPSLFKGSGGGGGGMPPGGNPPGKPGAPKSWADCKTDEERAAYLKANPRK